VTTMTAPSRTQIATDVERALRALLPDSWSLSVTVGGFDDRDGRRDAVIRITPPGAGPVAFGGRVMREATAQDVTRSTADRLGATPTARPILIAAWLSPTIRDTLSRDGVSFADATGNVRMVSEDPALVITGIGAARNPWPRQKILQSLKGPGAARALRAILQAAPPFGVRELATRAGSPAATLSRVLGLLERDGLVERDARGGVLRSDVAGIVRRWSEDHGVLRSNDARTYLQPRGLPHLAAQLAKADLRYALTGSLAANLLAPVAPARLGMLYVTDVLRAVEALGLRETETGGNVVLLRPPDDGVFTGTIEREDLRLVSPPQLAVDLLTSPGRSPAEGEAILTWMTANPDAWRS